jgi:hypothetical protein
LFNEFKTSIEHHLQDATSSIFKSSNQSDIISIRMTYCCDHGILFNLNERINEVDETDHRQFHHLIQLAKNKICYVADLRIEELIGDDT